jgi:hypothetical protein
MLSIVTDKIYFTYIITIPKGGDDNMIRLKLNRTQVTTSYSFHFYIQIKHINTYVREE